MKWKALAKTAAAIKKMFNIEEIPINAEGTETDFTPEQKEKLEAAIGVENAAKMIKGFSQELRNMTQNDQSLKAVKDEIDALVLEANLTEEQMQNFEGKNGNEELSAKIQAIKDKQKEQGQLINKLLQDPEGDVPTAIIQGLGNKTMKHSDSHLFATGKSYDAFEKRPWNARFRDGNVKATDFNNESNIPTLQDDLKHFVTENPSVINSLFSDFEGLPEEWSRRTGVLDRVEDGFVIAGEVVQGRKKGWSPKGRFKFSTEQGRVYRKKIDITFDGYELQEIENTWLRIKNSDGSHPWKMSFIGFLLSELVKRQKVDDRNAQINGIFVETPEGHDMPGAAVNSQNGLLYLWWFYRDVAKKYRPFTSGELLGGLPTNSNIVDYIEEMINNIPEDYRKMKGLEIQLSDKWMRIYRKRAGEIYNLQYNTDQGKKEYDLPHPIDRPNFKFQVLKDMTNTDFIGITFSENVQILDFDASEKGKFTITHEKRDTHIFADYRQGIRFIYVGNKLATGEPEHFEVQYLWSNNAPIFNKEITVPAFDDRTALLKMSYPSIEIDEKWVTDIVDIEGNLVPGQIVRIKGNAAMAGVKNLKNNAKFDLASDYPLNTDGTITLYVKEDKTLKEISRTNEAPTAADTAIKFDTTSIDANEGIEFKYTGTTATVEDILNGIEGKTISIYGSDTANVTLTLTTAGNINMASDAALASSNDYVQLTLIDGSWIETKRVIA
ncbi:MAG: hypothetical protein BM557_01255 [Flavobacterium sp. MedPE-SWcel]|uniref:hypothetical protein n=1 Tax=uncultured Flavobacterium sp. TaxID=165435 RepID=UPI0009230B12|nr:hypothetical protein [uncultured Flavobacterium sp.]OIQ22034.1 MAG: hypothetical protein BM557_01255 [Flavobacterium sp. MedPE-SWcel]